MESFDGSLHACQESPQCQLERTILRALWVHLGLEIQLEHA